MRLLSSLLDISPLYTKIFQKCLPKIGLFLSQKVCRFYMFSSHSRLAVLQKIKTSGIIISIRKVDSLFTA